MLPQGIVPALNMVCFSGFFSHRAMLLFWNNGLIGFPIIGKNNRVVPLDNFMIYKDIIRLDRPD